MLFTSYYAKRIPDKILKIGISLSKPKGIRTTFDCKYLAPNWDMLKKYKQTHNEDKYTEEYFKILNEPRVYEELKRFVYWSMSEPNDIALLCWEGKGFCHRHLLASFIEENFGVAVPEL